MDTEIVKNGSAEFVASGAVERMPGCWSVMYHLMDALSPEKTGLWTVPAGVGRRSQSKCGKRMTPAPWAPRGRPRSSALPKWICNPEVIWKFPGSRHKKWWHSH